jgi:HD-like signal output (HDOD) protein
MTQMSHRRAGHDADFTVMEPLSAFPDPESLRRRLLDEVTRLPVGQDAGVRLLWLLADDQSDAAAIGRVVESDPALTFQILRVANSPYYGLSRHIGSVRQAVTILGVTMVRALTAAQVFRLNMRDARALPRAFWEHSFAMAVSASNLALDHGIDPAEAFSAGMLLDIGTALLRRNDPSRYAIVEQIAAIPGESLLAAERRMFGVTHADVGGFALERLRFPRDFANSVAEHHLLPTVSSSLLARTVFLAELLGHMVDDTPQESTLTLASAFEYVGEDPARAEMLVARARASLDEMGAIVDLMAA